MDAGPPVPNKNPPTGRCDLHMNFMYDGATCCHCVTERRVPRYDDQCGFVTPSISAERKATPIWSGVLRYFPDAQAAKARLSKKGNDKHNPGEPLHWSRGKSNDHGDCIIRHQLNPDEIDPETGELHAVAVAWRADAQLQLLEEQRILAAGGTPLSGVTL